MYCSAVLYAVIAFERFLPICFPLWHRVYITKRHIWSSTLAWLVSVVIAVIAMVFNFFFHNQHGETIFTVCYSLISVVVFIIIVLFITTFVKACHSINAQPTQSNHGNNLKKQVRLTMIFFIMFIAF